MSPPNAAPKTLGKLAASYSAGLNKAQARLGASVSQCRRHHIHLTRYIVGEDAPWPYTVAPRGVPAPYRLGDVPLTDLTLPRLSRFERDLRDDVASATASRVLATLRAILDHGVERSCLSENAARSLYRSHRSRRQAHAPPEPPTNELVGAFAAADAEARPFIVLAATAGLTAEDLRNLRWAHLELDAGLCRLPPLRNGARRQRTIPLASALVIELRQLRSCSVTGEPLTGFAADDPLSHKCLRALWMRAYAGLVGDRGQQVAEEERWAARLQWRMLRQYAFKAWAGADVPAIAIEQFAGTINVLSRSSATGPCDRAVARQLQADSRRLARSAASVGGGGCGPSASS